MSDIRTRPASKSDASGFLHKAASFLKTMKAAEAEEDWNAACLNAIHAAISASDAVASFYLGERSAGQRHEDAANLLKRTRLAGAEEKARQLLSILSLKSFVEYSPDEPGENEARQMTKQAQRIFEWAKQVLNE